MLIGAGGAARAIVNALSSKTANITILVRSRDLLRIKTFKKDFCNSKTQISFQPISDENLIKTLTHSNIIINATPIGMWPDSNSSLIESKHFELASNDCDLRKKICFDVIFNPVETKFLKLATAHGCVPVQRKQDNQQI